MKKLLVVAAMLFAAPAHASPYFRVYGITSPLAKPSPVLGALIDPQALGNTEVSSLFPLITHSPKDGCILPSIVCEDWSPLAVGGGINAGKITFVVAPVANVLPWMGAAALAVAPAKWQGLINVLKPSDSAVTFSAGPAFEYKQLTNKGYFRIFSGLALHF